MVEEITFRAVVEVLGKPKEHVEQALAGYIENLKKDENYTVNKVDLSEIKKQEEQDMWATFAELEVKTADIQKIITFCFDYMPSIVEIISPKSLTIQDEDVSVFLNDLQAKLHQVDMVAKQLKFENDHLHRNMGSLVKNYVMVLLSKGDLSSGQLSKLTGIEKDKLEDFLDKLIDDGKIDLRNGYYFLNKETLEANQNGSQ